MPPDSGNPLKEGSTVSIPFTVTDHDMDLFASLSGDRNALHQDGDFARSHGFADRVVYGGILVGALSRLLGMELPGEGWIWHRLALQFRNPLLVGQAAEIHGRVTHFNEDLGVIGLRVEIQCDGRCILDGDVQAGRLKAGPPAKTR